MRCEKCRKEITGIGKPAVPPAIPAILAWGGAVWAMWSLTLGENPLPGWTPISGWGVGLVTLGVATVLAWYALIRRKCPECGSTRMLQAMEEESVLATERQAAREQAVGGLRAEAEAGIKPALERSLRADIEAELRAASVKEASALRTRLEKELRDEIGQQMRAGQAESERGLRQKLASELRPEIEKELRPRIEERLWPEIERDLRPRIAEQLRPEIEKELWPRIEEQLRPELEKELQPRIEEQLRPEIEKELWPRIEEKLRPEIEKELRARLEEKPRPEFEKEPHAGLPKPAQPEADKPRINTPAVESAPKATAGAQDSGHPASKESTPAPGAKSSPLPSMTGTSGGTPPLVSTLSPVPKTALRPDAPGANEANDASLPVAKRHGTFRFPSPSPSGPGAAKPTAIVGARTPIPATTKPTAPDHARTPIPATAKPSGTDHARTPTPATVKPTAADVIRTPIPATGKPATPDSAKISTPVTPTPAKPAAVVTSKSPATVTAKAGTPAVVKAPGITPAPVGDKPSLTPGVASDGRERAERRARVIVSDLSLYHKDLMAKAAQAADPKKELGSLWKDAILAYDRTVPLEVRNNTHYLEDELNRYLAQVRQAKANA
jgi:hypothetical protein